MVGTVYRSLVIGLLAAMVMLLARPGAAPPRPPPEVDASPVALIDVDRAAAGDRILELLGLAPGERVLAIDGEPAALEDVPGRWRAARPGEFLDLLVSRSDRLRRVLVLVHR